jgi:hypothetical protein
MSALPMATAPAKLRVIARKSAIWLLLATLAWAPFPLGGAIAWAPGLQEMLVAACWLLWAMGTSGPLDEYESNSRILTVPLVLALLVLVWAAIQMLPVVPASWTHPIWGMASEVLNQPVAGTISLNPWLTETEILKLASYIMAGYLAFQIAQRAEGAKLLLNGVILIGAAYAAYAFVLAFAGTLQTKVFYALPYKADLISGPFMLHNSFATYSGLAAVAAMAKLFAKGEKAVAYNRGWRRLLHGTVNFCFGNGAFFLVAAVLTFAGVMASASRAGFAAAICGLIALAVAGLFVSQEKGARRAAIGALAVVVPLLVLIGSSGDTLFVRLGKLFASDAADPLQSVGCNPTHDHRCAVARPGSGDIREHLSALRLAGLSLCDGQGPQRLSRVCRRTRTTGRRHLVGSARLGFRAVCSRPSSTAARPGLLCGRNRRDGAGRSAFQCRLQSATAGGGAHLCRPDGYGRCSITIKAKYSIWLIAKVREYLRVYINCRLSQYCMNSVAACTQRMSLFSI